MPVFFKMLVLASGMDPFMKLHCAHDMHSADSVGDLSTGGIIIKISITPLEMFIYIGENNSCSRTVNKRNIFQSPLT